MHNKNKHKFSYVNLLPLKLSYLIFVSPRQQKAPRILADQGLYLTGEIIMNAKQFIINSEQSLHAKRYRRNVMRAKVTRFVKSFAYRSAVPFVLITLAVVLTWAGV